MEITNPLTVADRADWRNWLEQNHASAMDVWLIIPKARSGLPGVTLEEAQEESLCFGWIDGQMKRIDEQRYALRFTPRKAGSNWSPLNKRRVLKLIREGRMTEAGLAKVTFPLGVPPEAFGQPAPTDLPEAVLHILESNPAAWKNFQNLPPSARQMYTGWISSAKRDETRLKRATLAVKLLEFNLRLGIESPEKMLAKARAAAQSPTEARNPDKT